MTLNISIIYNRFTLLFWFLIFTEIFSLTSQTFLRKVKNSVIYKIFQYTVYVYY